MKVVVREAVDVQSETTQGELDSVTITVDSQELDPMPVITRGKPSQSVVTLHCVTVAEVQVSTFPESVSTAEPVLQYIVDENSADSTE